MTNVKFAYVDNSSKKIFSRSLARNFFGAQCKMAAADAAARLQRSPSHLVLKFALVVIVISSLFRCGSRDLKLVQLHNVAITVICLNK